MNRQRFHGNAVIIDDQDHVIRPLKRFLESVGFQKVFTTNSGEDGYNVIKHKADQISVVFLDMLMPGWSGARTFQAIKDSHPDLPVIVMSGYLQDHIVTYFNTGQKPDTFLQKPFDLEDIHQSLQNSLGVVTES